ncbi:heterokaryon incompatibility protein-domain-containing protein, partial [Leptodontidium sp. 2 PMI_412]
MWPGFMEGWNGQGNNDKPNLEQSEDLPEPDDDPQEFNSFLVPYEYFSLPALPGDRFIRLLELLPGERGDDIQCRLHLHHLESDATYEALSYVWGNDQDTLRIQVDDQALNVTRNLRSALRHLRCPGTSRMLWVDAVCIDQNNTTERTQQVGIMSSIYRTACRTVVWLGTATEDTGKAFSLFATLAKKKRESIVESAGDSGSSSHRAGEPAIPPLTKIVEGLDAGIENIIKRPWFNRVWVVQEIALGRSATVVCGWNEMSWDTFAIGIQTGLESNQFHTSSFGVLDTNKFYNFDAVATIQKRDTRYPPAEQLLSLLIQFRRRQATDPRDKIFSLLGLVEDIGSIGLAPDYASSTAEVYKKTTATLLMHTGNLDVLGMCSTRQSSTLNGETPSWVGDWSNSGEIAKPFRTNALNQLRTTSASGSSTAVPVIDEDITILFLEGHVIDRIASVGDVLPNVQDKNFMEYVDDDPEDKAPWHGAGKVASHIFSELFHLVDHFEIFLRWEKFAAVDQECGSGSSPTGEGDMVVYWQTLCAGCMPGGFSATEKLFKEWYKSMNAVRQLVRFRVNTVPSIYKALGFAGYLRETWKEYAKFGELMAHATYRRLARTEKGYLCMVPSATEKGDSVLLCKGGKVPLVMRQHEEFWKLIGESYVHGLMNGEGFNEIACESIVLT